MFENSEQYTANKILILFILNKIDKKVTDNALSSVLLGPGLVNYFTVQECKEDLITKGCVKRELDSSGSVLYSITDLGKEKLEKMMYMLSGGLGARYEAYIEENRDSLEKEITVNGNCFDDKDGNIYVRCYVRDNANCIVDVKLPVSNRKEGALICEAWKKNTSDIYMKLVKVLYDGIKNEEENL